MTWLWQPEIKQLPWSVHMLTFKVVELTQMSEKVVLCETHAHSKLLYVVEYLLLS